MRPPSSDWPGALFWLSMRIGGRYRRLATAFAIAPDRLMTAAHAVYDAETGAPFERLRVQQVAPETGEVRWSCEIGPAGYRIAPGYLEHEGTGSDYAVLQLPAPLPCEGGVPFRLWAAPDGALASAEVVAAGFPRKGPPLCQRGGVVPQPDRLLHRCIGGVGTSGAPLWLVADSGERLVVGIHSRSRDRNVREAARITTDVVAFVRSCAESNRR